MMYATPIAPSSAPPNAGRAYRGRLECSKKCSDRCISFVSVTAAILLHAATSGRPGDLDALTRLRLYARGLYLSVPQAAKVLAAT